MLLHLGRKIWGSMEEERPREGGLSGITASQQLPLAQGHP